MLKSRRIVLCTLWALALGVGSFAFCTVGSPTIVQAEVRTWTTANGKFSVEAELVSIPKDGKSITIKRKDNEKVITLELEKLCEIDIDYVDKFQKTIADSKQNTENELKEWKTNSGKGFTAKFIGLDKHKAYFEDQDGKVLSEKFDNLVIDEKEKVFMSTPLEFREWTKEKTLGKLYQNKTESIVLKDADEKNITIQSKSLTEADCKYLELTEIYTGIICYDCGKSNKNSEFAVCMIVPDSPAAKSGFTVKKAETRGKRLGSGAMTYYSNIEYPRGCRPRNKLQYFQWDENILFNVPYKLRFKHDVLGDLHNKDFIKDLDKVRIEKETSNKDMAKRNKEIEAKREQNVANKKRAIQNDHARQRQLLFQMDQIRQAQPVSTRERETTVSETKKSRCTPCNGTGRKQCTTCKGTGLERGDCSVCKGKGMYYAASRSKEIVCPECNGARKKKCHMCRGGNGRDYPCPSCSGSGYK